MDEDFDRMLVSVRADTAAFARDVGEMRAQLDGPLAAGADRAGRQIEGALMRAIRTGKLGFEDLKRIALSAMAEIATSAISSGIGEILSGSGASGGSSILSALLGMPGRATGGPVSPGRAYVVGERGPELFVPTSSGTIAVPGGQGARDVRVTINLNAPAGVDAPQLFARSGRQVARAVRMALAEQ